MNWNWQKKESNQVDMEIDGKRWLNPKKSEKRVKYKQILREK